jgi:hypothetical protein
MLKSKALKVGAGCVLALGIASAASADLLSLPAMIPDFCAFGHCVQFTHTQALTSAQQVVGQIQQLKNEATMIAHLPMSVSAAAGDLQAVLSAEKGIAATVKADTAAKAIANEDETDVAEAARLQRLAQEATGAASQAQVGNGIALQQLQVQQRQLELQASQQLQDQAQRQAAATALSTLADPIARPTL